MSSGSSLPSSTRRTSVAVSSLEEFSDIRSDGVANGVGADDVDTSAGAGAGAGDGAGAGVGACAGAGAGAGAADIAAAVVVGSSELGAVPTESFHRGFEDEAAGFLRVTVPAFPIA